MDGRGQYLSEKGKSLSSFPVLSLLLGGEGRAEAGATLSHPGEAKSVRMGHSSGAEEGFSWLGHSLYVLDPSRPLKGHPRGWGRLTTRCYYPITEGYGSHLTWANTEENATTGGLI
ncbi:hypothetical protein KIL84_001401 [Mauremys mutica]|uniref:Uncharacterized protein n=1 Tax=Mauremys mutica TaxID=74926 RepID=A0A9D4AVP3_9SAUR|nr:hypothetical protein KIL84_001401 [Mauremys mutica]